MRRFPNHLETLASFVNFERRQDRAEAACALLSAASLVGDADVRAVLVVMHARLRACTLGDTEGAEALYETHWGACAGSRYFVLNYLDLERGRGGRRGPGHHRAHLRTRPGPAVTGL